MADVIVFLASDGARWITGASIPVGGDQNSEFLQRISAFIDAAADNSLIEKIETNYRRNSYAHGAYKIRKSSKVLVLLGPMITAVTLFLTLMVWVRVSLAQKTPQPTHASAEQTTQTLCEPIQNNNEQTSLHILEGQKGWSLRVTSQTPSIRLVQSGLFLKNVRCEVK